MKITKILQCKILNRTIIILLLLNFYLLYDIDTLLASQEIKILADDGNAHDFFGESVAISGGFAVIGAKGNNNEGTNGTNSGSVYIYELSTITNQITSSDMYPKVKHTKTFQPKIIKQHNSKNITQQQTHWTKKIKLNPNTPGENDYFGCAVAISGNYVIVGAHGKDNNPGAAYIFYFDGISWSQQQKLVADDIADSDLFGCSVSIYGDYAIVGAKQNDTGDLSNSGAAYIFKRDGTVWTQLTKLTASDAASFDFFGFSVSIYQDFAIVGSIYDDTKGSAYIYHMTDNNTIWTETKLTVNEITGFGNFGWSVAITDQYAMVSAKDIDYWSGAVYAYKKLKDGSFGASPTKLTATDRISSECFGSSVFISGDYAIIGAMDDDDRGSSSGSAYVFHYDAGWMQKGKIIPSEVSQDDVFGCSVSISDDRIIVGAQWDDDNGFNSGSAYIIDGISTFDYSLSVELTSMTLKSENGKVIINWNTECEIDNLGFNIYRSQFDTLNFVKLNDILIQGAGNSSEANNYSYADENIIPENTYYYKLEDISTTGQSKIHKIVSIYINKLNDNNLANNYKLFPAYPNPCNPSTTIQYNIPAKCFVNLKIYDIKGNLIKIITNENKSAGQYKIEWHGLDSNNNQVGNGLYFFNLTTSTGFTQTQRIVLLK